MLVSFVVPVYNTEAFLPRCIESVLAQREGDFELILVDDGSSDACPAICDAYAARDRRVRVIHQANVGVVAARNRGAAAAQGTYVCFVDSDDAVDEGLVDMLARMARTHVELPDVVLFGHRVEFADHVEEEPLRVAGGTYDRRRFERELLPTLISDPTRPWWTPGVSLYLWGKAYRREYLCGHLFSDVSITLGEDVAMCMECLVHARSVFVSGEVLYTYVRTNGGSVSRAYRNDLLCQFSRTFVYLKEHVGGEEVIDVQLDDYFCYRILRAVYIEVEHEHEVGEAASHLAEGFGQTQILDLVKGTRIPIHARVFLWLLRHHRYREVLAALKLIDAIRFGLLGKRGHEAEGIAPQAQRPRVTRAKGNIPLASSREEE